MPSNTTPYSFALTHHEQTKRRPPCPTGNPAPATPIPQSSALIRRLIAIVLRRRKWSASPMAFAGPRAPCGLAIAACWCGATCLATACTAGTKRPARSARIDCHPTTATATPVTVRAASSPASTSRGGSRAPSTTGASSHWPIALRESGLTRRTMWW